MASAILIENGADRATLARALDSLPGSMRDTVIVIAAAVPEGLSPGQTYISSATNSLAEAIQQAATRANSDMFVFIDSRSTPSTEALTTLVDEMQSTNSGFGYAAIETGSELITLGDVTADGLVSIFNVTTSWPFMAVATRKSIVDACGRLEGESMTEIMTKLLIESLAQSEATMQSSQSMTMASVAAARNMTEMSALATARCLQRAVDTLNIEDLFPHHAWSAHREESAAASYHSLAAMFIRLGDADSALDCLSLGDQFEDSPRSLALKGIIALDRGETLAAVANMVSSLQQYEIRKKQNNRHYVHFAPRDLAGINDELNAGLAALNKRDNSTALEHFASAVFSFDSFYQEHGVTGLKPGH